MFCIGTDSRWELQYSACVGVAWAGGLVQLGELKQIESDVRNTGLRPVFIDSSHLVVVRLPTTASVTNFCARSQRDGAARAATT